MASVTPLYCTLIEAVGYDNYDIRCRTETGMIVHQKYKISAFEN